VSQIHRLPWIGARLEGPFKELLVKQKEKLHRKVGTDAASVRKRHPSNSLKFVFDQIFVSFQDPGLLSWIFEKFVLAMIVFFLLSIVNSLAQSYHKRIQVIRQNLKLGGWGVTSHPSLVRSNQNK